MSGYAIICRRTALQAAGRTSACATDYLRNAGPYGKGSGESRQVLNAGVSLIAVISYVVNTNCPGLTCSPPYVTRFDLVVMYVMRKRRHKAQAMGATILDHGSDGP